MLRPQNNVLFALLATAVVVTGALAWFGWRNWEQESSFARQRERDRLESSADAIAAGMRGRIAESGERLSAWVSGSAANVPEEEGAVVLAIADGRAEVRPRGGLPFVPVAPESALSEAVFAPIEALEFGGGQPSLAEEEYRRLSRNSEPQIRAGALLRLGRVLRKVKKLAAAGEVYRTLAQMSEITVSGLPAELIGLDGQRLALAALGDAKGASEMAVRIARSIDGGRWLLARGSAEFYRDAAKDVPKPDEWLLAEAADRIWREPANLRAFEVEGRGVVGLWRAHGQRSMMLVSFAERFLAGSIPAGFSWQLTDAEGRRFAGESGAPLQTASRVIGGTQSPWMLKIWTSGVNGGGSRGGGRLLATMLAMVILFLWGTVYFMARAIRRESAVARLQSDFVAAVSHEFRSPLTTVRQLSEMLEMGQVPNEERRQKYYSVLSVESRRLQRLVETLLNFGKMEAGAQQYKKESLDVAEVVGQVVKEVEGQSEEVARRIRTCGQERLRVRADAEALRLAVRNLVDNALKYSPAESSVEVEWGGAGDRAAIRVTDHGAGIPKEEQPAVFEKFVRGRAAVEGNVKGTGVGLSMVRHIAAAHGGEIQLESEPGRGSVFTLVLPQEK